MEREEYGRMAALEDTLWWYRALHRDLVDGIVARKFPKGARLLDAGCGTGGFLARVSAALPGLACEGIELDEEAAAMARRKTGLAVAVGSVEGMPYPSGSFSIIVSSDVLSHSGADEQAALAEFRRCLAPGGLLLLNLPAYEWLWSAHDERIQGARRYTARGARAALISAGFVKVSARYGNSLLFPLMVLHRVGMRREGGESDVRPLPEWQDRSLFAVTSLERRLGRLGLRLPFGGSVRVEATR